MSADDHEVAIEATPGEARAWRPGDPDRRKLNRSLLELTGTTAGEHLPAFDSATAKAEAPLEEHGNGARRSHV